MRKVKFYSDNMGRPLRTLKVCGACGSTSTLPLMFLGVNCGAHYVCCICNTTLVLADDNCDTCPRRVDCLLFPSVILMCESQYFFPEGARS